jgi:hypothetical protein
MEEVMSTHWPWKNGLHRIVVGAPLALGVVLGGCGAKESPSAIDCYAELPEDVKDRPSKRYRATPTRPGPVVAGSSVTEQLQASYQRDSGNTEGLFEDILEDWVGIAYDPAHADPTSPAADWDPDFVFDVAFSDRLPTDFTDSVDHFESDKGSMVWATVDRAGIDLELSDLAFVITDSGCDRLVPSANEDFVVELAVPEPSQ